MTVHLGNQWVDGESLREQVIEELRADLNFREAATDGEEYAYVQAVLDSLIQLNAAVPVEAIEPFEKRWRAEYILLLARQPGNEAALLSLRDRNRHLLEWLAVSNLLLHRKSRQFVTRIVAEIRITHEFKAEAAAETRVKPLIGQRFPSGFPPIGMYHLTLAPFSGDALLAHGPKPVY